MSTEIKKTTASLGEASCAVFQKILKKFANPDFLVAPLSFRITRAIAVDGWFPLVRGPCRSSADIYGGAEPVL
jgi:hypothetical protein